MTTTYQITSIEKMKRKIVFFACIIFFSSPHLFSQIYINNQLFSQNKIFYQNTKETNNNQVLHTACLTLQHYLFKLTSTVFTINEVEPTSSITDTIIPSPKITPTNEGIHLKIDPSLSSYLSFKIEPKIITITTQEAAYLSDAIYYFLEKYFNLFLFSTNEDESFSQKRYDIASSTFNFSPSFKTRNISSKLFESVSSKQLLKLSNDLPDSNDVVSLISLSQRIVPISICPTDIKEHNLLFSNIINRLKENPNYDNSPLSIALSAFQICSCKNCKKIDKKEKLEFLYTFINALAKELTTHTIFLEVDENYLPSSNISFLPNIQIRFTLNYSFNKPLHDTLYKKNNEIKRALQEWKKHSNKLIVAYPLFYQNFQNCYAPTINNCGITIKELSQHKIERIEFILPNNKVCAFDELKAYLVAQMMWDASQNPQKIIKRFLNYYYQEAGQKIASFINFSENNAYYLDGFINHHTDLKLHSTGYLSLVMLRSYKKYFTQATALVENKEAIVNKISILYESIKNSAELFDYNL